VSLSQGARKRASKAIYTEECKTIIVEIWKRSEQPCGRLLKATLPLWLKSHKRHHGPLPEADREKILK